MVIEFFTDGYEGGDFMKIKDTLTREDMKKWARNVFIFSSPSLLVFLMALQTGDFQVALGAFYSALLASLIDLIRKYSAGIDEEVSLGKIEQTTKSKL